MLSNACQYAIRSALYLSIHSSESDKFGVKIIAEELETPQPFLAKVLQKLSKRNLISSTKGPNGGFFLTATDQQNSIWDIVMCIDGDSKFNQCFLGLMTCDDKNPCPVHFKVAPFKTKILGDFKDKTIKQYSDQIKRSGKLTLKNFNPV